jgi:hypothetical protein
MEKQLGKEYPVTQRVQFLKDNCDKVEKKTYMRRFTPDELRQKKDQLAEASITLSEIDDEKKEILQDIKTRQEPLKSEKKILLSNIKHKAEEVKEECYKFIDQENSEVGFYNSEGDLIEQRPAYPDERQGTIFQISRTGTEN